MERDVKHVNERHEEKAPGAGQPKDGQKQHIKQSPGQSKSVSDEDKKLNEALKETFPASDPPASGQVTGREKPKSRIDRQPAPVSVPTEHKPQK